MENPWNWFQLLIEHTYYLLPLCVHVALPFLIVPDEIKSILDAPLPTQMQQLHAFAWLLGPLIVFALGSYCLDSKNSFCFFPGTPYFHRVLLCSLINENGDNKNSNENDDNNNNNNNKNNSSTSNNDITKATTTTITTTNSLNNNNNNTKTTTTATKKQLKEKEEEEFESREKDLKTIRDWAVSFNPPENMSSHWCYKDLKGFLVFSLYIFFLYIL
jgi:hypothetical protein